MATTKPGAGAEAARGTPLTLQEEAEALLASFLRVDLTSARRHLRRFAAAVARAGADLDAARLACYELVRAAARLREAGDGASRLDWTLLGRLGEPRDGAALARAFETVLRERLDAVDRPGSAKPLVVRARLLIERRAAERLSLAAVARELGVSASYLSSLFSRTVGMTVTRYIHEQRLRRAERLLRVGGLPLSEVAHRSGYRSYRHFHRTFVRLRGVPPAAFRRSLEASPSRARRRTADRRRSPASV